MSVIKPDAVRPLRILMLSKPLHPMIGGLETAADVLATEMVKLGQKVTVVTLTPSNLAEDSSYVLIRRPSFFNFIRLFIQSDCVVVQGLTLQLAWPVFILPVPAFVIHQGLRNPGQGFAWLRLGLIRRVTNVVISKAVGDSIPGEVVRICNPYDSTVFRLRTVDRLPKSLIFVGRLVEEKGPLVLLNSLASLKDRGLMYDLTIVGDGPLRTDLETAIVTLGLKDQVRMTGPLVGGELAEMMNAHHVAIVPSLWPEPFGIVALEAIACGCEVIGTSQGGLPEAIGPCGTIVPNGDVAALASAIETAASKPLGDPAQAAVREAHLQKFKPSEIATSFLTLFRRRLGLIS